MTERVVVTLVSTTGEFTYGDYQDWNNALNKIECSTPARWSSVGTERSSAT